VRIIPTSAVVVVVLALSAVAIGKCDSFGDTPRGARLARAQQSPLWHDGQFKNPQPIWADTRAAWLHLMFGLPTSDVVPDTAIPVVHESVSAFATALSWR